MNFLQLCQRFRREAGISGTHASTASTVTIDMKVQDWINDAWMDIQLSRRWDWMRSNVTFNTVSGQRDYTSSDAAGIALIRRWDERFSYISDSNSIRYPLYWLAYHELREVFERSTAQSGRPQYIAVKPGSAMQLRMSYTPSAAEGVSLWGWLNGTYLSGNTDEPELPTSDHMIIVHKALMSYALKEAQGELLLSAKQGYEEKFKLLIEGQSDEMETTVEPLA